MSSNGEAPQEGIAWINSSLEMLLRLHASRKVVGLTSAAVSRPISQPGLVVLRRLVSDGPLPMGELARASRMDGGAAARLVTVLESEQLVRRDPSASDGRISIVSLTEQGADLARRVSAVQHQHMVDALSDWQPAEIDAFAQSLGRFVQSLRQTGFVPPKE
jgi:DNA-binding MarR family transcriptional regulator